MMDETTIRLAIRATARISFVLFLDAFLGNALYCLVPVAATRWLKANKDAFTLGFAASHTVHLAFVLTLITTLGREQALKRTMPVPFTIGFLLIYSLAADVLFRHPTFLPSRFEAVAHYYLMALFAISFTRHAMAKPLFYTPFAFVAVVGIGVRIVAALQSRRKQPLRAST